MKLGLCIWGLCSRSRGRNIWGAAQKPHLHAASYALRATSSLEVDIHFQLNQNFSILQVLIFSFSQSMHSGQHQVWRSISIFYWWQHWAGCRVNQSLEPAFLTESISLFTIASVCVFVNFKKSIFNWWQH